ncbi:unnamed protein product [Sympodiomycopsis kandeliae]
MAMATKRPDPPSSSSYASTSLVKRTRVEDGDRSPSSGSSLVPISSSRQGQDKGLVRSVKRTSGLSDPIIQLSGGHRGHEILDVRFSNDGEYVAAAGGDKTVSIWKTYSPNNHVTSLESHGKAVTCLSFVPSGSSSQPQLLTGSADSTIILWSILAPPPANKLRRFRYHQSVVNAVVPCPSDSSLFASGSDDGNVCIWKTDERKPWEVLKVGYPVTALEWTKDGSGLFVGGIDNQIHLYDLHRKQILYTLSSHTDTISVLRLSPSGSYLLSYSFDSSIKIWDVRPFAIASDESSQHSERLHKTLTAGNSMGSTDQLLIKANWSKMKIHNSNQETSRLIVGCNDGSSIVWNVEQEKILYKLPGHRGTCTAVDYHPKEPIIVSASTDGTLYLGEIEP